MFQVTIVYTNVSILAVKNLHLGGGIYSNSTQNSMPSQKRKKPSSSSDAGGLLFLEFGSSVRVVDGASAFVGDTLVKFTILETRALKMSFGYTSNEECQLEIEAKDIIRRVGLINADIRANNREISAATNGVENLEQGAIDDMVRLHGINGNHKKHIRDLDAIGEVTIVVEECGATITLVEGKMTAVSFIDEKMVWCPDSASDVVVVATSTIKRTSKCLPLGDAFYLHDQRDGLRRWRLTATAGDIMSQAHVLQFSPGCTSDDMAASFELYHTMAQTGNATAQYNVGESLRTGQGVGEDADAAILWLRASAIQGHAGAQYKLGECYYDGDGVAEDKTEAARWYRLAAVQNYPGSDAALAR